MYAHRHYKNLYVHDQGTKNRDVFYVDAMKYKALLWKEISIWKATY